MALPLYGRGGEFNPRLGGLGKRIAALPKPAAMAPKVEPRPDSAAFCRRTTCRMGERARCLYKAPLIWPVVVQYERPPRPIHPERGDRGAEGRFPFRSHSFSFSKVIRAGPSGFELDSFEGLATEMHQVESLNFSWFLKLRWGAIAAELLVFLAGDRLMHVSFPLTAMLLIVGLA